MRKLLSVISILGAVLGLSCLNANALLISGPDINNAPTSILDDTTINDHMQAFNEAQGVLVSGDYFVDGGFNLDGLLVSSHMIFLNTGGFKFAQDTATWGFDGQTLGGIVDKFGALEVASSGILGAAGTDYPDAEFRSHGSEGRDAYLISPDLLSISVSIAGTEPRDWIRVVTALSSPVPEPATMFLFGTGIAALAGVARRKKK